MVRSQEKEEGDLTLLRIPCTIMRGGTSKGLFFLDSDLPPDPALRKRVLLAAFGSPDPRQIDGLGGADPLTSKLAIIGRGSASDRDIDYTFGQVSITEPAIDFSGNCGNMSSAVGPFAIEKGLVPAHDPVTTLRILNTNTKKMIVSDVPVKDGAVMREGSYRIDGVPGCGAEIRLHFLDPGGVVTGKLLPTGRARDVLQLTDGSKVDVTLIDAGNPAGFVPARQVGLRGDELPAELEGRTDVLDRLEEIRARLSELLGLTASWKEAYKRYTTYPKIAVVAPAGRFKTIQGLDVSETTIDLQARVLAMGRLHKAFAVTASIPAAAAACLPDSTVTEACGGQRTGLRIGHPSGVLTIDATWHQGPNGVVVDEVTVGRTARTLMEGTVFVNV